MLLPIRKGNVLAIRAGHFVYLKGKCPCHTPYLLGREVSLLLGLDTTFLGMEVSLLLGSDITFIWKESFKAFCWKNKNDEPASRARLDQ